MGGDFPQIPHMPSTIPPQPPAQYYPPAPPLQKGKGRALTPSDHSSMNKDPFGPAPVPDDEDMYMSRPMSPQVLLEPTPPVTPPRRHAVHEPQTPRWSYADKTYQLRSPRCVQIPVFEPKSWPADLSRSKPDLIWVERNKWDFSRSPSPPPVVESSPPRRTPSPRQPSVEPDAPDDLNPPRHSGRTGRPVNRPDNVYRNRPPVDILADKDDDPFQSPSQGNQSPGPSGGGSGNDQPIDDSPHMFVDLVKMAQDGGANLINFLLRAAASSTDAKGKIPEVSKVREWQYRDLMRLPKAVQEERKIACKEELEALH